jgi:prostaglandin reductase 2
MFVTNCKFIIKKYLQQQKGEKNIANYYIRKKYMSTVKKCILSSRPGLGKPVRPDIFSFLESKNRTKLNVLKDGEIYCETMFLSVDPYMRCMLDENHPQLGEYLVPQALGQVCSGGGVGKVIESKHPEFQQDTYIVVPFLG